jgi:hypothetical protein
MNSYGVDLKTLFGVNLLTFCKQDYTVLDVFSLSVLKRSSSQKKEIANLLKNILLRLTPDQRFPQHFLSLNYFYYHSLVKF